MTSARFLRGGPDRSRTGDLLHAMQTPRLPAPESGGDSRDRTGDLLHAMQTLYQLSYIPLGASSGGQVYLSLMPEADEPLAQRADPPLAETKLRAQMY